MPSTLRRMLISVEAYTSVLKSSVVTKRNLNSHREAQESLGCFLTTTLWTVSTTMILIIRGRRNRENLPVIVSSSHDKALSKIVCNACRFTHTFFYEWMSLTGNRCLSKLLDKRCSLAIGDWTNNLVMIPLMNQQVICKHIYFGYY